MSKRPLAALAATLLALGIAGLSAPAANAATIDRPQSCWQEVDTGKSLCVDSSANLAGAVFEMYGIELSTPDGELAVSEDLTSARSTVTPLASTVIGIFYENNNYGGAQYGYYVNSSNVGAAMNDRASSIRWAA